jgi:CHASE1-domain containing sensor protein
MIKGDRVAVEAEKEFSRLKAASGLHWFHWLIVFSSFALTFFAWYFSSQQVKEKTEQQFLRQANQVVELISERMRKYEDALWSGVATIHAQSYGISPDEWQRFSSALRVEQRYLSINGIGVIYDVKPD